MLEKNNKLHYYFSTYENYNHLEKERNTEREFIKKYFNKCLNYFLANKEEIYKKASCHNNPNPICITSQFAKYLHINYSNSLIRLTNTIIFIANSN